MIMPLSAFDFVWAAGSAFGYILGLMLLVRLKLMSVRPVKINRINQPATIKNIKTRISLNEIKI